MEELKTLFGEGSLSYSEFEQKLTEAGETIKLANLKSGNYVDKSKYDKLEKGLNDYKAKYGEMENSVKDFATLKSQYDELEGKYNDLVGKQDFANKMSLISKLNVDERFAEFVYDRVNKLTDDKKDFQTALNEYLKDNSQYLISATKPTYVDLQNGKAEPKDANQKMNDFIRGRKKNGL